MFRKLDSSRVTIEPAFPSGFTTLERVTESIVSKHGHVKTTVGYKARSCEEISKEQLDPKEVTADFLLQQNLTIDPSTMVNVLNITDVADLDDMNEKYSGDVLQYLEENEDTIRQQFSTPATGSDVEIIKEEDKPVKK